MGWGEGRDQNEYGLDFEGMAGSHDLRAAQGQEGSIRVQCPERISESLNRIT